MLEADAMENTRRQSKRKEEVNNVSSWLSRRRGQVVVVVKSSSWSSRRRGQVVVVVKLRVAGLDNNRVILSSQGLTPPLESVY